MPLNKGFPTFFSPLLIEEKFPHFLLWIPQNIDSIEVLSMMIFPHPLPDINQFFYHSPKILSKMDKLTNFRHFCSPS